MALDPLLSSAVSVHLEPIGLTGRHLCGFLRFLRSASMSRFTAVNLPLLMARDRSTSWVAVRCTVDGSAADIPFSPGVDIQEALDRFLEQRNKNTLCGSLDLWTEIGQAVGRFVFPFTGPNFATKEAVEFHVKGRLSREFLFDARKRPVVAASLMRYGSYTHYIIARDADVVLALRQGGMIA